MGGSCFNSKKAVKIFLSFALSPYSEYNERDFMMAAL